MNMKLWIYLKLLIFLICPFLLYVIKQSKALLMVQSQQNVGYFLSKTLLPLFVHTMMSLWKYR